jgi:hypothetical protein
MSTFKNMNSFSKALIATVALTYLVIPSIAYADETVTTPTLPISEEVAPVTQSEQTATEDSATKESTTGAETTSSSETQTGLLDDGLNNATDRGTITNEQGLTVKTGIDKTSIIAGAIATFIGFSVFFMIGILRKINYGNDENQEK